MSASILDSYLKEFPGVYAKAYTRPEGKPCNRVHVEIRRVRDDEKCFTGHGVALGATGETFPLALRTLAATLVTLPAPHVRDGYHPNSWRDKFKRAAGA